MPDQSLSQQRIAQFLTGLASKSPAPGGGAVAALTGAHAAALAGMVVAYSIDKKTLAEHHEHLAQAAEALERIRAIFLELMEEDASAYATYSDLRKADASTPGHAETLTVARDACLAAPRSVLAAALELLRQCEGLVERTNPHLASDLAVAAVLAEACAASAAHNVRTNLSFAPLDRRDEVARETDELVARAAAARKGIESGIAGWIASRNTDRAGAP